MHTTYTRELKIECSSRIVEGMLMSKEMLKSVGWIHLDQDWEQWMLL
jgi:hypothetical protein